MLRGFYNVCMHRAHELLTGNGKAKIITCPYHAWSYHLTGELRTARPLTSTYYQLSACQPLRIVSVTADGESLVFRYE